MALIVQEGVRCGEVDRILKSGERSLKSSGSEITEQNGTRFMNEVNVLLARAHSSISG